MKFAYPMVTGVKYGFRDRLYRRRIHKRELGLFQPSSLRAATFRL
ncbi:hypothetical protein ABIE89_000752 [Bradyrhizobium niftali]|jgi:hypothetical protein